MTIERTGNVYSMASSEFRVTYPDGHVGTIWSPPWHEMGPDEEQAKALSVARERFAAGTHKANAVPAGADAVQAHVEAIREGVRAALAPQRWASVFDRINPHLAAIAARPAAASERQQPGEGNG